MTKYLELANSINKKLNPKNEKHFRRTVSKQKKYAIF